MSEGEALDATVQRRCKYVNRKFQRSCPRPDGGTGFCRFHDTQGLVIHPTSDEDELRRLLQEHDGEWMGFHLQDDITFSELVIEHGIDLRSSEAKSLVFKRCVFKSSVDISRATFQGDVEFESCTFEGDFIAEAVRFGGEVRWSSSANARASFDGSTFAQRAKFLGSFNGHASFNRATFFDVTDFVGGWLLFGTIGSPNPPPPPEPRYLFNAAVQLEQLDFRRPERVQFRKVDLRKAYTTDTDFRKVRFYDTLWFQEKLGRNGFFHEVDAASDPTAPARYAALWEANYRNIRLALEDSKDFNAATDFYVGEMEWRRAQLPGWRKYLFSVEAMYCYLSNYGGSPMRAFACLAFLVLGYGMFATLGSDDGCLLYAENCHLSPEPIVRALSLLEVYRQTPAGSPLGAWWRLGEMLFKIAAVVQLALFVMALRNRIKRG